ncbi:DUF423 domain-containing protein [Marinobacterium nitratireducens]|nr:DUF423 domain-containing protein [Marinobacterium nitratireducens]
MNAAIHLRLAACSGFVAVALGAFAAHGLKSQLAPALLEVFQTAVQYQFYHSLAWLLVALAGLFGQAGKRLRFSGYCFGIGILLFSGSLYVLALGGVHWLGAVTPLGGVAFLLGWLLLAGSAGTLVPRTPQQRAGD